MRARATSSTRRRAAAGASGLHRLLGGAERGRLAAQLLHDGRERLVGVDAALGEADERLERLAVDAPECSSCEMSKRTAARARRNF